MLNSKLKVKVDIVPFADLNSLNVPLNLIDPSEEQPLVIVFSILDDTSSEIHSVNLPLFVLECSELICINFLHYFQSKVDQLLVGIGLLEPKQRTGHSIDSLHVFLLPGGKLSRLNINGLPDKFVIILADSEQDDFIMMDLHSVNCYLVILSILFPMKYCLIFSLPKVMNLTKLK